MSENILNQYFTNGVPSTSNIGVPHMYTNRVEASTSDIGEQNLVFTHEEHGTVVLSDEQELSNILHGVRGQLMEEAANFETVSTGPTYNGKL